MIYRLVFKLHLFLNIIIPSITSITPCFGTSFCNNTLKEYCSSFGFCFYDFKSQISKYNISSNFNNTEDIIFLEKCRCQSGYYTIPGDPVSCCYKMKSQKYAFMLNFFLNLGLANFYIGQYIIGSIKLSINVFIFYFICSYCCCRFYKYTSDLPIFFNTMIRCLYQFFIVIFVLWWIFDLVCFGFNLYRDSNGVPLFPW